MQAKRPKAVGERDMDAQQAWGEADRSWAAREKVPGGVVHYKSR